MRYTLLWAQVRLRQGKIVLFIVGYLLVVLIEAFNWYQRHDQGPSAVAAGGMWFSLLAVVVVLGTGWLGWEMVYRRRVGIADETAG